MSVETSSIVRDPLYGFLRVDPIPDRDMLTAYYEDEYYENLRARNRAPDVERLASNGVEAERERAWLRETVYDDIQTLLSIHAPGRRVLDVGCGTGDVVAFLAEQGFDAAGIELSPRAVQQAQQRGLDVRCISVDEASAEVAAGNRKRYDAITLIHVLEHVADAPAMIRDCRNMLAPDGVLAVIVPNDFSALQRAAEQCVQKREWWVAIPDHVNYFDFESLARLLGGFGFDELHRQADFPMEMFLLMGENYVDVPNVGRQCHERRVRFERNLPSELRRAMYRGLAQAGVGRDCVVFAKKRSL